MNLRKALTRKPKGTSGAAKNYLGRATGNRPLHDEGQAAHVTTDVKKTAAKIREIFQL